MAATLRKLRVLAGLTQRQLADKVSVDEKTIQRIENGNTSMPKFENVAALADFFEMSLDVMTGRAELLSAAESLSPEELDALAGVKRDLATLNRLFATLLGIVRDVPGLPADIADRLRRLIDQQRQGTGEQAS